MASVGTHSLSGPHPSCFCIHAHTVSVLVSSKLLLEFKLFNFNQGALEVMRAMKISDLIGIKKGLIKITQSLKKMKETFKLMHSEFESKLVQFNQFTCCAFYEGRQN